MRLALARVLHGQVEAVITHTSSLVRGLSTSDQPASSADAAIVQDVSSGAVFRVRSRRATRSGYRESLPAAAAASTSYQVLKVKLGRGIRSTGMPGAALTALVPAHGTAASSAAAAARNFSLEAQRVMLKLVGGLTKDGKKGVAQVGMHAALQMLHHTCTTRMHNGGLRLRDAIMLMSFSSPQGIVRDALRIVQERMAASGNAGGVGSKAAEQPKKGTAG
jgi:hypothetical protein